MEYFDHDVLTNRFLVTHYGGSAVLFNMDTFLLDIKIKSIYFHNIRHDLPDKVFEGESGLAIQGVISRASFRRQLHGVTINANNISVIEGAFAHCDLPLLLVSTPLWGPGAVAGYVVRRVWVSQSLWTLMSVGEDSKTVHFTISMKL